MAVTNAAIRSRIERLVKKWRPILGLESWGLTVLYDEREHLATCAAKPEYEEATLHFNLGCIRRELPPTLAAIEELVLHELTHCIAWRANERTVSRITRSILRARDSG
jgi:predicted SprT family Zn-dependent metalloprotease